MAAAGAADNALFWLHCSFRFQAFVSTVILIPMLTPLGFLIPGFERINDSPESAYAIRIAASIMVSSPILSLWADQKPMERKDVLLILVIPAVGFMIANLYSTFIYPLLTIPGLSLHLIMDLSIILLHLSSYCRARQVENKRDRKRLD